ncbi:MAG: rhodanese-like domain-containing protein [Bacteroidetes bacterium]|nr:rhodanese-like domain-containing protein [Bacteroidota bacterium]
MDIKQIINQENANIIDVREPFEFITGHIDGATNIPLGSLPSRIDEFRSMEGPIVMYCRSGNRSGQAAAFLNACGVEAHNAGSIEDVSWMLAQTA